MHLLDIAQSERVIPLVRASGMHGHLTFACSVLEGRQPGLVFVDSVHNPRTALVCNLSGFYFAFGKPDEAVVWPLVAEWVTKPLSAEQTLLLVPSTDWAALFDRLLPERTARRSFAFRPTPGKPPADWRERIPAGFQMQPITESLAQGIVDGTLTGGYGIDPWFIRIAGGPEAYAAEGLGQALVTENEQIASLCGFCALGNGEAEMEVGTVWDYRGRGLAVLACAAFLEQCQEHGLKPAYTTAYDNIASIQVARKLGFEEIEIVQSYPLGLS